MRPAYIFTTTSDKPPVPGTGSVIAVYTDTGEVVVDSGNELVVLGQSAAPPDATFVTLSSDGDLSNEAVLGTSVIMSGLASARPAAATAGLLYFATDTDGGTLYRDTGSAWVQVGQGVTRSEILVPFPTSGTVSTGTGALRVYVEEACTIVGARASVGTAPTGATLIVDVNKNGTTIYTTQGNRPTIAISGNTSGTPTTPDVTSLAAGDYLTVDTDQVGSSVAGADLMVTVVLRKA